MRKAWALLLGALLSVPGWAQSPWLDAYRVACERWNESTEAQAYLNFVQTAPAGNLSPAEVTAFQAAAEMIHANHGWNPIEQWNTFVEWRDALEAVIEEQPEEPNLRLVRYGIQSSAPKFLGYRAELEEDRRSGLDALAEGFWSESPRFENFVAETLAPEP